MITDTMTKYEVMTSLRKEFDDIVLPHYHKVIYPRLNAILRQRCQREKKTISIGWETLQTNNRTTFKILKRGHAFGDLPLFVCEFHWNDRLCFGNFFQEGNVVIYQAHCLQRYAQRVLQQEIDAKSVFYDHIVKRQGSAYNIVLPTPTHQYSHYFGLANALFLGDFDIEHPKSSFLWCNTCISFNEARYSQLKITTSLHEMQRYVEKVHDDFSVKKNEPQLKAFLSKYGNQESEMEKLKTFFTQKYLLWQLHLSFNFCFTDREELDETLEYIDKYLVSFGIHPKSLSPYSKNHGIAWKGEIDYKGE
jgi:hypothetical protein